MKVDSTRSRYLNFIERTAQGKISDWGEVVTRYPYENVGMDFLLSMEFFLFVIWAD